MSTIRFLRRLAIGGVGLGLSITATSCTNDTLNRGAVPTASSVIPATYFGMHENNAAGVNPWPRIPFGGFRSWDAYEIEWSDLEPSRGSYNWEELDNYINALNSQGVTDILYTFGYTPSWASAEECQPPTSNQDMIDFVTAIVTHTKGKIKHWETWNEPYLTTFWCGTMAQLVELQNNVYNAVKRIDATATVHTPVLGISAVPSDCNNSAAGSYSVYDFLASNGTSNFDIVDVHMYANPRGSAPENSGVWIANLKCSLSRYGIGSVPLWNTEFGWGLNASLPNANDQVAYVARSYLYYKSEGLARSYWYAYNNDSWGTIFDGTSLNSAGVAYQQVYNWMVGATLTSPCKETNGVWTCGLTLANGNIGQAVWLDTFQSASVESYTPGGSYDKYHDLAGGTTIFSGSVTISEQPLLLEGGAGTLSSSSFHHFLSPSDIPAISYYPLALLVSSFLRPVFPFPETPPSGTWMRRPTPTSISTILSSKPRLRHAVFQHKAR